ncbi:MULTISPECIES: putative phage holin [Mycobacteriaceae]|uniref:putative phage holin n=1 Tax=Mycobacteriaceae TaxID=1762 RepID=UPI000991DDB4|nr:MULTISPECIES: hypothetical protein [Mycobacteriaceae]MDO3058461.1 hypothetical protein [Mycobacteroides abscessus subsp. abscessus]MDO3278003.1 hypothetical protein [Mycobacteroides abscessus subsp. abscessus]
MAFLPVLCGVAANRVADVLLIVAALASWAFTLLYLLRSPWWVRPVGRNLVSLGMSLSLVLSQNALSTWWGDDYPLRSEVRALLYAALTVTLVRLGVTIVRYQRR